MKNQAMNENVKATVSTTYFTFNHLTRKIVGTELNFKKSGTPGSAHDIELMARIAEHPNYDFLVIKPEKEKNSYKGLKRELVHDYIDCFGSAEQMAEFEKMKDESAAFGSIKSWFLTEFPTFGNVEKAKKAIRQYRLDKFMERHTVITGDTKSNDSPDASSILELPAVSGL